MPSTPSPQVLSLTHRPSHGLSPTHRPPSSLSQQVHFIRCIKPNTSLKAFSFTPRDFALRLRKYGALLNRRNGTGKRSASRLTEDEFQREMAALWAVFPPQAPVGAEKPPATEAPAEEAAEPSPGSSEQGTETPREAPPAPEEEAPPSAAKSLRAHPLGNFTPTHCI